MINETPNPDNDAQNKYKLQLNNKSYFLTLDIRDNFLIFICNPFEEKPKFYYIYKCTLNSLRKMSKAFHLYQNLTEVLYLFEELYKNKLISLEIGDDINYSDNDNESYFSISNYKKNEYTYEFINLVVKLFVLVKEEVIIFPMEKKEVKENAKIVEKLKKEIKKIYDDFNKAEIQYEDKIESLKKEVKLLRNENVNFKNQINELINKIEDLKNLINKNNNKKNNNSIQDLINRVEKLEEWKIDSSFTNKNINISINDSQKIKNENQFKEINKNENILKTNKTVDKIETKTINKNSDEEKENASEEEELGEIDDSENGIIEKDKEVENIEEKNVSKKEENNEMYVEEEEEEEDDEEEEEKEIINNNKTSFNFNIKYKEQLLKSLISQSDIIRKSYEIDFFLNEIMKLNPISFTLLYKGSQDTDSSKIFHQKCDNIPNILLVILTNQNYIFGGYTSVGFDSSGNAKKDAEAFLFSVDFQKIYEINKEQYAIFCNKNCGPIFCGKSDGLYNICIPDQFFKNKSYTCKKGVPFNTTELFELNHGEKEFQVVELEIYKIDKN